MTLQAQGVSWNYHFYAILFVIFAFWIAFFVLFSFQNKKENQNNLFEFASVIFLRLKPNCKSKILSQNNHKYTKSRVVLRLWNKSEVRISEFFQKDDFLLRKWPYDCVFLLHNIFFL
jgi:hypothetical protein